MPPHTHPDPHVYLVALAREEQETSQVPLGAVPLTAVLVVLALGVALWPRAPRWTDRGRR